jgi:hypothetical protein
MSELGQNGYLAQVSQINSNISNFRDEKQNVSIERKKIDLQAKAEQDMDDIRKIGSGYGEQAFKKIVGKWGNKLMTAKFGEGRRSLAEIDKGWGEKLGLTEEEGLDSIPKLVGRGVQKLYTGTKSIAGKAVDLAGDMKQGLTNNIGDLKGDAVDAVESKVGTALQKAGVTPPSSTVGQEGVEMAEMSERALKSGGFGNVEISQEAPQVSSSGSLNTPDIRGNVEAGANINPDTVSSGITEEVSGGVEDVASAVRGGIQNVASAVKSGVQTVASETADLATASTLEGIGGGLEATGVLAPLGALFSIIGFGADVYAGVEGAEGVVNAFQNDVLGQHSYSVPKLPDPTAPVTLAQKGFLITPTSTTIHQQGSSLATGW